MVDQTAHMFITGPEVIKTVTNEVVSFEELGGAMTHGSRSGVSHFTAEDDESAIQLARDLCDMLPSNNLEKPPSKKPLTPSADYVKSSTQSYLKNRINHTMLLM